ncbi:MAG TPA: type II toxin-antitoxin system VapC family toxin [Propionibacteriaceae bacterium]|nr:type II toxin-antitoxin system VapC family toxin [Propionibacteriaceae bacterium]
MAYYVDTSALVKMIIYEHETRALIDWLVQQDEPLVSCDLVRAEIVRATRRRHSDRVVRARQVLEALVLTRLSPAVLDHAGRLDPIGLTTLDAVHLAAALDLGDDLSGLVTYDDRLAAAAEANGVAVVAPQ